VVGFLNHPLIQMPSVDYIPQHLHHVWDHRDPA
jgi:hypothetical protein